MKTSYSALLCLACVHLFAGSLQSCCGQQKIISLVAKCTLQDFGMLLAMFAILLVVSPVVRSEVAVLLAPASCVNGSDNNLFSPSRFAVFILGPFTYHALLAISFKVSGCDCSVANVLKMHPVARLLFSVHLFVGAVIIVVSERLKFDFPYAVIVALLAAAASGAPGQNIAQTLWSYLPCSLHDCTNMAWWRFPAVVLIMCVLPAVLVGRFFGALWINVLRALWAAIRVPALLCSGQTRGWRAAVNASSGESSTPLLQLSALALGYLLIISLCMFVTYDSFWDIMWSITIMGCALCFMLLSAPLAIQTFKWQSEADSASALSITGLEDAESSLLQRRDGQVDVLLELAEWGVPWAEYRRQMHDMEKQIQQHVSSIEELKAQLELQERLCTDVSEERQLYSDLASSRLDLLTESDCKIAQLETVISAAARAHNSELSEMTISVAQLSARVGELEPLEGRMKELLEDMNAREQEVAKIEQDYMKKCKASVAEDVTKLSMEGKLKDAKLSSLEGQMLHIQAELDACRSRSKECDDKDALVVSMEEQILHLEAELKKCRSQLKVEEGRSSTAVQRFQDELFLQQLSSLPESPVNFEQAPIQDSDSHDPPDLVGDWSAAATSPKQDGDANQTSIG